MFRGSYSGLGFLTIVVLLCVITGYIQKEMRQGRSDQIGQDVSSRIIEDEGTAVAAVPDVKKEEKKSLENKSAALPRIDRKPTIKSKTDTAIKAVEAPVEQAAVKPKSNLKPVLPLDHDLADEGQLKSRWIDSLSGRHVRMDFVLKSKSQNCTIKDPCQKEEVKDLNLAGVVVDTDAPQVTGDLAEGNFIEHTPALYVK